MRQHPRVTLLVVTIAAAAITVFLPAIAAQAAEVTVRVFRPATAESPNCTFSASGVTAVTIPNPATACESAPGVTITARPGTSAPQVAALEGASQNQVVIRNAVIKNTGTDSVRVEIAGTHLFATVITNDPRSYGIGLNASFSRRNASGVTILACNDQITKQGFYAYFVSNEGVGVFEDQIGLGVGSGTNLIYNVPCSGSTTQNTIPVPAPSATESNRKCTDLAGSEEICVAGERLTTAVAVTLVAQNDQVTVPGGVHTIAAGTDAGVNAVLGSLTAVARLHQNTPNARVNPFDMGHLIVELLCNEDFPCENVDQTSLRFAGAIPVSVEMQDIPPKDGFADLFVKVAQQDTGIVCGDTSATLSGTADFPGQPDLPFDAIVGFYTGPGCP